MAKPEPNGALVTFNNLDEDAVVLGGTNYIGEMPPANKALPGHIRRVYLSQTTNNDPVLKVLYEVTEGAYTGFIAWDNVTLNNKAAFKWQPLLAALGIGARELKTATRVDPEDESEAGMRVVSIGALDLSGDNTVPVTFGVSYKKYDGILQVTVAGVLPRKGTASPVVKQETATVN